VVEKIRSTKPVIVKTMTVNKKTDIVHNFFDNMKYMEMGGAIRPGTLRKGNDGWWTFYHNIAGEPRLCNGFRFEKDFEVDANYLRLFGWDVLC
jgi:hypothetical protein